MRTPQLILLAAVGAIVCGGAAAIVAIRVVQAVLGG
jgi:hypothetical protein